MTPNAKASGARRRRRSVSVLAEGIRQPYGERAGDRADVTELGEGDVDNGSRVALGDAVSRRLAGSGPVWRGTRTAGTTRSGTVCRSAVPTSWPEMLSASGLCSAGQIWPEPVVADRQAGQADAQADRVEQEEHGVLPAPCGGASRCRQVQNRLPMKATVVAITVEIGLGDQRLDAGLQQHVEDREVDRERDARRRCRTCRARGRSARSGRAAVGGGGRGSGTHPRVPAAVTACCFRWRVLTRSAGMVTLPVRPVAEVRRSR